MSSVATDVDFLGYGVAEGIGPGPAYPVGLSHPDSVLELVDPSPNGEFRGVWGGQKVLWFVSPAYRGPVLIRGRQLEGTNVVRFEGSRSAHPPAELRIRAGRSIVGNPGVNDRGQRYRPSYTRLRAAGCYAYQIDGTTFSRVIVFRAERVD